MSQFLRRHRLFRLAYSVRFAREGGLVTPQVIVVDQSGVRRDAVPLGQYDDISRNQLLGQDALLYAIPDHGGIGRQQFAQRRRRLLGPELLRKTEHAVDDVDHEDRDAELGHLGDEPDDAADPQEDRHQMREVRQELPDERPAFHLLDRVAAIAFQALFRLGRCQSLNASLQKTADLGDRQAVNHRFGSGLCCVSLYICHNVVFNLFS